MTPERAAVCRRVLQWRALAQSWGPRHGLDPWLVLAVVAQESSGVPTACRPEPGFWRRYGANVVKAALASLGRSDDRWVQYPEIASCSYGLCQCMYPVALEVGMDLDFPTDLCDPGTGIAAGCRVLARCLRDAAAGNTMTGVPLTRAALLRYNGGGDSTYPDKVLSWRGDLLTLSQGESSSASP